MRSLDGIDDFVRREMDEWKVPGLAIAVVKGGDLIHKRGYGRRDIRGGLPVTSQTLFPIGSITKSMTVATLSVLARQGHFQWDIPIREYLPDFRLWDQTATEKITLRDMVAHRSGVPGHDWVWINTPFSREELYHRLRYLEPCEDFRQSYQYNNLIYMATGALVKRCAGVTWEQAMCQTLFAPLDMRRAACSIENLRSTDDYAEPHKQDDNDIPQWVPLRNEDAVGPAGTVIASVDEMARYIAMHLDCGTFQGRKVIDRQDALAMQTPLVVIPDRARYPEMGHRQYGMGFIISTYRGHTMVYHEGYADGFSTIAGFLPDDDGIGAVVLCNLGTTRLPSIVMYRVFDQILGLDPAPWSARYTERKAARKPLAVTRISGTRPWHRNEDYGGEYEHPAYGTVAIRVRDAGTPEPPLMMEFHGQTSPLEHFHYDIFETPLDRLNPLERVRVRFESDGNGEISSLFIPFEPKVADIRFVKTPSA
ncbi:MAG: serine hydrolase [Capsulimonadaceae bacterium]